MIVVNSARRAGWWAISAICISSCIRLTVARSDIALQATAWVESPEITTCHPYPPSIGEYLKIDDSSDYVLEHVGPPNAVEPAFGELLYGNEYWVEPFPTTSALDGGICYASAVDGASFYDVFYGPDKKIESVVYYQQGGTDSQQISVPVYDGLMLPAMLYRPRKCRSGHLPALIVLHGWGPSSKLGFQGLRGFSQILAEQGYVVLMVSMRGWHGVGVNDCGLSQPKDIARAVEWLGSQPGVDAQQIGLVGISFGGQVSLLTAAMTSTVKAVVSIDGPTDIRYMKEFSSSKKDWWSACLPDLDIRSPVTMAARIKAPVLLVHGDADTTVPPEQAYEMEDAIWRSGGVAQLHLVSGSSHQYIPFYSDAWPVILKFLAEKLGNHGCETVAESAERR
jgi:dienelactone hydrolase